MKGCDWQEYKMLELYAGCGGFSFIANEDEDIKIIPTHAVDTNQDALDTYKFNHPDALVSITHTIIQMIEMHVCV